MSKTQKTNLMRLLGLGAVILLALVPVIGTRAAV